MQPAFPGAVPDRNDVVIAHRVSDASQTSQTDTACQLHLGDPLVFARELMSDLRRHRLSGTSLFEDLSQFIDDSIAREAAQWDKLRDLANACSVLIARTGRLS